MIDLAKLVREFQKRFVSVPRIFRAPGRVNLIGEHIDYSEGFVLPIAIDRHCAVLAAPRTDRRLRFHSEEFDETIECALTDSAPKPGHWSAYVRGVAWVLTQAGEHLTGADMLIASDVPIGAGLSSSAAIEVATAFALLEINRRRLDRTRIATLCQRAENEYVGMRCGIMDQLVACCAAAGDAILIDCRTLETSAVRVDANRARIVVANTMARHKLVGSEYNQRRKECEDAVQRVRVRHHNVRTLRDVTWPEIESEAAAWPDTIRRRARHVTTEIARVQAVVAALRGGNFAATGRLMAASHASLASDFEVSCKELNTMVEIAASLPGCFGARMTGGGFGGCTVNLVAATDVEGFVEQLAKRYRKATSISPEVYVCEPSDAAGEIKWPAPAKESSRVKKQTAARARAAGKKSPWRGARR
jgi:galactokinase